MGQVTRQSQRRDKTWAIVREGKRAGMQAGHRFNDTQTKPDSVGGRPTIATVKAIRDPGFLRVGYAWTIIRDHDFHVIFGSCRNP